jgi:hypothetical protein
LKDSNFIPESRLLAGVLVAFLIVAVLAAIDIFSELETGVETPSVALRC